MRTSAIFLLYILALVCLLCGCKQVQYVPVETVRLDSIYLTQTLRDSIVRYDSVYVRDKGDTLYVERWKYLYRDKKGKLLPYADKNHGLFEVKECFNEKTQWSGTQTFVTPKGRETFRLLAPGA